jgi:hypothetical protein
MSVRIALTLLAASLAVMLVSTGCAKTKKNLDKNVDKLVETFHGDNYDAFISMSHSSLVSEVPQKKFDRLVKVFARLGKMKDRTMKGISVASGKPDEGTYTLEFEKGEIGLVIRVKDDELVSFDFTGERLDAALAEVQSARYAEFRVYNFQFQTDEKTVNPAGSVYSPNGKAYFRMLVGGITAKEGHYQVHVDLKVKSADGALLLHKPDFLNARLAEDTTQPPVMTVNGNLDLKGPATLTLELTIADKNAGKTQTYSQTLTVKAP